MQQDRRLQLPGVHVGVVGGDHAGRGAGGGPVVELGEQRHPQGAERGLLHDVAEHVVAAVPVDQDQRSDAVAVQRGGDVADDGDERRRGQAHGARPGGVLVGAGERDRGEQADRVGVRDAGGDGRRDDGVGRQRQVRTRAARGCRPAAPPRRRSAHGRRGRYRSGGAPRHGACHGRGTTTRGRTVDIPEQGRLETAESELATRRGRFRAVAFREHEGGAEHLALVHGDPRGADDVLVRVHSECLTGDVFGALRCECGAQLESALDAVLRPAVRRRRLPARARGTGDRPAGQGPHPRPAGRGARHGRLGDGARPPGRRP